MVDEDTADLFPEMPVTFPVIAKYVTLLGMIAFVSRDGCDHLVPGKYRAAQRTFRSAAQLPRQACLDCRMKVPDGMEKFHCIRHQGQAELKIGRLREHLPEPAQSMTLLECTGLQAQHRSRAFVEVGGNGLHRQQPSKECSIALKSDPKVLGRDIISSIPLTLKLGPLGRKHFGETLHCSGDELVSLFHGPAGFIDEPGLY